MTKTCEILNYISSKGKYSPTLLLHCFQAIHFHQSKWGYVTSELLEESISDGTKKVSGRTYSSVDVMAHLALLVEVTIAVTVVNSRIRLVSCSGLSDLSDEQHIFFKKIIACLIEKVNLLPYGIGKLIPFSHYVDDFKADAEKSCNFKEDYHSSSASTRVSCQSSSYSSVLRDRASSFSGMVTDKTGMTPSSHSTPSSRAPSPPSFAKVGGTVALLPKYVKAERVTPRRIDKFGLPPSAERNIDCKVSNVAFMALVRRDGSDIMFPQVAHDKLLCIILAAITSEIKPCHKELIDMVICYKEFGNNKYMEKISKTKVRGVISLLKQAKIIDVDWYGNRILSAEEQQVNDRSYETPETPTSDATFAPAKLVLSNYIHSYLELRRQHDNYLIHFAYMNDREREEEHYRHRDSGPKNTWNADKAIQRTDKTSFSEIIWSDGNCDERIDYCPIIQHASTFFANNYRTIVESMKLTVDLDNYSDSTSLDNAGPTTSDTPSIAFPRLSPARVMNESPMNEWDSMKCSPDSGDTDISDSSQYSMWHSLVPSLQHHAPQLDARANNFSRLQLPPGYPCQPDMSCVSNVYGDDNSIYCDENILKEAPQLVRQSHVHNAPDNRQNLANIGFLALQDYRKKFR